MALDNFRTQKIIWDRANKKIFEKIEANSGDSNGRKLVVQVINQGVTENLSGTTLSLGWKSRKGAKGLDAFNVVDASKGIFEIYYTTEMLSNIGDIEASFILIDSTGRIESSAFTISVRQSTVDNGSVESENSFTALTEALVKVNDLEGNYAPRLNELTTQLAQTDEQVIKQAKRDVNLSTIKRNIPLVSFVDDDGNPAILTKLKPLSETYGVPFTVCMPSDFMLGGNGLSAEELKTLQDEHGFEIASHAKTHNPINDEMSKEQQFIEVYESWRVMREHGLNIETLVYPYGQYTDYSKRIASMYYKAGVSTDTRYNNTPIKTYSLGRFAFPRTGWTLDDYKAQVDEAVANNSWLIFMLHCGQASHDEERQQILEQLIQYIQSINVDIVNVTDGIDISGNILDINNQEFYISGNGDNNMVNYVPLRVDNITEKEAITFNMKPSDFKVRKTYRTDIVSQEQIALSPTGGQGILTVVSGGHRYQTYRTFIDRNTQLYISNASVSNDVWEAWEQVVISTGRKTTTISGTVPAGGTLMQSVNLGAYTNRRFTHAAARVLHKSLLFTYTDNGIGGELVIQIFNPTSSPINVTNMRVDYYSTTVG